MLGREHFFFLVMYVLSHADFFFFLVVVVIVVVVQMMTKFNQEMYARMKAKKNEPLSSIG